MRLDRAENDEHTALHYAVLNRDLACTRFLLEAGADPHKGIYPHRDATSPLTLAEDRGYDDVVALIRGELDRRAAQAGADPERGEELFDLVREGDLEGVERLLEADPERIAEVDTQGRKPLHAAAAQADLPLVLSLAARDDHPSQTDAAGHTPLDCALLSFRWTQRERAPAARAAAQALLDAGAEQTPRGAAALGDLAFLRPIPKERLQQATGIPEVSSRWRSPTGSRRCWTCCSPGAWIPTSASIWPVSTSRCRAGACRFGTPRPTVSTRWRRR